MNSLSLSLSQRDTDDSSIILVDAVTMRTRKVAAGVAVQKSVVFSFSMFLDFLILTGFST